MTTERMTGGDAAWLHMDRPTNLMVVNAVFWFDEPLDWAAVTTVLQERLVEVFPRFRQRVLDPPVTLGEVSRPRWEDVPGFRVEDQVRRSRLEGADREEALHTYASQQVTRPLDRDRPLWEVHLLDGYGDGSAVLLRTHHALADGIALVQVLLHLADPPAEGRHPGQVPLEDSGSGMASAVTRRLGRLGRKVREDPASMLPTPSRVADVVASTRANTAMLRKLGLGLSDQGAALRRPLGIEKRLTWSEAMPLEDVKRVGRATSSTVNDVALALIAGALRHYLDEAGRPLEPIRAVVPYNLRPLDEPLPRRLGNRFGLVFVELPVDVADRRQRVAAVTERMATIKASSEGLVVYGGFSLVSGRTPVQVAQAWLELFARRASAVITNIAGPRERLSLAGTPLTGFMLWVPTSGSIGVGLSIVSYAGRLTLGVAVDPNVVPDSERLLGALQDEMAELVELLR
jgi:diacylglycerol O-acyltransferase / wax synthase